MKYVFLSYRRTDSSDITGRIYDELKERFGEDALFKDVDAIPMGRDFRAVISEAVGQCKVLLAIIGHDWLAATDPSGRRRIDDPNDYVHVEIASALKRGIPVVPVLVRDATMPAPDDLPAPLKDLAYRHGLPVRPDPDFHHDMDRLCQQLAGVVETGRWRRVVPAAGPRFAKALPWALGGAMALLLIGLAALYRPHGRGREEAPPVGQRPTKDAPPVGQQPPEEAPPVGQQPPKARVPIRYWIESLPEVPGEDAARLFSNALGLWESVVEVPMRQADTHDQANVIVEARPGQGTVAQLGPPRPGDQPLVIIFDPAPAWTRRTFEAWSCRLIGHILGLDLSSTPGQLMSDWRHLTPDPERADPKDLLYDALPPKPQPEDIRRVRAIWEGAR